MGLIFVFHSFLNKILFVGFKMSSGDWFTYFFVWINIHNDEIKFNGNDAELYFEEDNFDSFIEKLNSFNHIEYVHKVFEHRWGQRVVRFYDPDKDIIEVGENIKVVCKRFLDNGLTVEETAKRMDVPIKLVQESIN